MDFWPGWLQIQDAGVFLSTSKLGVLILPVLQCKALASSADWLDVRVQPGLQGLADLSYVSR